MLWSAELNVLSVVGEGGRHSVTSGCVSSRRGESEGRPEQEWTAPAAVSTQIRVTRLEYIPSFVLD